MRGRGRPYHVTASGAVIAAGTAITLNVLNVNKAVSGGTASLYNGKDNTGTLVGIVALDSVNSFFYDECFFDAGLYIALSGASPDLTVSAS